MNDYKRIFRCALVALILTAVVSGVSLAERVPITMWLSGAQLGEWAEEFTAEFNRENPDIMLSIEIQGTVASMREKLVVGVAGGAAPDITYDAANMIAPWIHKGFALPLDDYLQTLKNPQDLIPGVLDAFSYNQKTWALPYSIWPLGDVYNMTLMADAGVQKPSNWEEMVSATRKLTRTEQGVVKVYGNRRRLNQQQAFVGLHLALEQLHSTSIPPEGVKATINTDNGRKALTYLSEVVQAGMPDLRWANLSEMLQNKVAIQHLVPGWDLVQIADQVTAMDLDIQFERVVGPKAGDDTILYNAGALFIVSSTKHPDAAWRVLQAFMEPENLKRHILAHGASVSMRMSHMTDPELRSFPFAQQLMAALTPPLTLGSTHPFYSQFRVPAGDFILKAIKGEIPVDIALEQAEWVVSQVVEEAIANSER